MPRITFHALSADVVEAAHAPLMEALEPVLGSATAHTTFEVLEGRFIPGPSHPYAEVAMFDRGLDVQDAVAQVLTRHILAAGAPSLDIAFVELKARAYYEDGEHL